MSVVVEKSVVLKKERVVGRDASWSSPKCLVPNHLSLPQPRQAVL